MFASARTLLTIDGHVRENVRHLYAGQTVTRMRQFPHAHRTRRSARIGVRLFYNRFRRSKPRKVQHHNHVHDYHHHQGIRLNGSRSRRGRFRSE